MQSAAAIAARFESAVGAAHVATGDAISEDYTHDEALTAAPVRPAAVLRPAMPARPQLKP